jgi:hypothetical protein
MTFGANAESSVLLLWLLLPLLLLHHQAVLAISLICSSIACRFQHCTGSCGVARYCLCVSASFDSLQHAMTLPAAPQTAAAAAPARTSAQLRHSTAAWTKQKQQHPRAVPSAALPSILPDVAGKQNVTDSHNALRARHSAGPLVWDEQLARAAAAYARKCSFEPDAANENSGGQTTRCGS